MRRLAACLALASLGLIACTDSAAKVTEGLTSDGYKDLTLTPVEGEPSWFDVTATRSSDGRKCTGRAKFIAGIVDAAMKCPDPDADKKAAEKVDPLAELQTACDGGDLAKCFELGDTLHQGDTYLRDVKRAREVHKAACDKEHMPSCTALGYLILKGLGGEQSAADAHALFETSCAAGHVDGCARLGRSHHLAGANKKAREVFVDACDKGSLMACNGLGQLTKQGLGGKKKDLKAAMRLFERACDGGEMTGCTNLGTIYMKGEHGPAEPMMARAYFERACEAKQAMACELLKKLPAE